MSGNKAMRRAAMTKDAIRISGDVPLITDTTELITPELAQEMLSNAGFTCVTIERLPHDVFNCFFIVKK